MKGPHFKGDAMKKRMKRLHLVRETLSHLENLELRQAAGGSGGQVFQGTVCECDTDGCGTSASTCPTKTICSFC